MKKMIPVLLTSLSVFAGIGFTGCSHKGFATGPEDYSANDTAYIPFTKALKQRLDHDNIDVTKVQFYVDQKLVLRRTMGSEKGTVKSGIIVFDNGQYVNEIEIPAFTPGVCEKANGDDLKVSFDVAGKTIEFAALYANNNFVLQGTNWHNGLVDINYDNQVYQVQCASCANVGDVKLLVRKNQSVKKEGGAKVLAGRKVN
jgi:hypothetical protein